MIKILFFASVRERLQCASLDVAAEKVGPDLESLLFYLGSEHGPLWAEVLGQENIVRAVNQAVVEASHSLRDGDEVAFFPPVTGG